MPKLRMNVEALEVVSFETAAATDALAADNALLASLRNCPSYRLSDCDTPCC